MSDKRYTAEAKEDDYVLVHMVGRGYYLTVGESRRLRDSLTAVVGENMTLAAANARIAELEAQLLEASKLLEPHIGHGVGILCVAEAVKAISARLAEAEKVADAAVRYFESDCDDAEFDAQAFCALDDAVREHSKLKEIEPTPQPPFNPSEWDAGQEALKAVREREAKREEVEQRIKDGARRTSGRIV